MPPRRRTKKPKLAAEESREDRISDLCDDLLHRVLSLLPAHEAVRTCVLSRRWRDVWRSVHVLRFTKPESWGSPARYNSFVNHVLSSRDLAPLEELAFKTYLFMPQISSDAYGDGEEPVRYASMWIQYALMRDVQVLRVLVKSRPRPLLLVNAPFISQHLTTLELKSVVLKGCSMDFSRCPTLESLELTDCKISVHKISSESLRRLCVNDCKFSSDKCTQILASNLVSLRLEVYEGRVPFLQSMPFLVTAYVSLHRDCKDRCWHSNFERCSFDTCVDCYGNRDDSDSCVVLGALSSAETLELSAESLAHVEFAGASILKRDIQLCPTFSKLKTLVLDGWVVASEVHALIRFLQCAPILEKISLRLREEREYVRETEESCSLLERLLPWEHLKIIEVSCTSIVDWNWRIHKLVKFLNTCSIIPYEKNIRKIDT
ncbi:hypothetical protein ACP70R_004126 [Stipagrostis hirtigluma subsp. patula]